MARGDSVLEALDRWEARGLLDPETAARLRAEALEESARSGRRVSRWVLGVAGGLVLLVAAGVLVDLLWPLLERSHRSVILGLTGLAVHTVGVRLEVRGRGDAVGWVLQTAGLLVLLGAFLHSEQSWPDVTAVGIFVGLLALATPLLTAPRALGRNVVMPAVHLALAPAFVAVFLDRATTLSADTIVWVVDAVVLSGAALLLAELGRASRGGAPDEAIDARLHAFTVALYAGLVMAVLTALGPLDVREGVWAVDAWWAGMTALTLWALHRAPRPLRRPWFRGQLAASVLLAVPLVFWTLGGALDLDPEAASAGLAVVGGAALAYALRTGFRGVLWSGAGVVVLAAWVLAVETGGALGALAALVFTAALLLWLSTRVGREVEPGTP